MELKKATKEDVAAIAALEARCFPKLEAATEASVRDRVAVYPNHFPVSYLTGHVWFRLSMDL